MAEQDVKLTYGGGWKMLWDIAWSAATANWWNAAQAVLLGLILWRAW
jgi:hypothetical protein